ncbi:hypothetical protein I588_02527, partial [Enterococcus pallens ATCC BAA-351]
MNFDEMKKKYQPSEEKKIIYRKYGRKFIFTSSPFIALFISSLSIGNVYATGYESPMMDTNETNFTFETVENIVTMTNGSDEFIPRPEFNSNNEINAYNQYALPVFEKAKLVSNEDGVMDGINRVLEVRKNDLINAKGEFAEAAKELDEFVTRLRNERSDAIRKANVAKKNDLRTYLGPEVTYHNYLDTPFETLQTMINAAGKEPTVTTAELIDYTATWERLLADVWAEIEEYYETGEL